MLREYVEVVVGAFPKGRSGARLGYLERTRQPGGKAYRPIATKEALVEALIVDAFGWARAQDPIQPLTSSLFETDGWARGAIRAFERKQLA